MRNTILFLLLVGCVGSISAQTLKELEEKRKKQEQEIALTKKILDEVQKKEKKSLGQLALLNKQINQRENLINTINQQIIRIDEKIVAKEGQINTLNEDLKQMKDELARLIVATYRTRTSYDVTSYALSSSSFNQAVKRIRYVKQIGRYRERQFEIIGETKKEIGRQIENLREVQKSKMQLLDEQKAEKSKLEDNRKEENNLISTLKTQEKKLRKDLAAQQKAAKELDNLIKKLIEEERKRTEQKKTKAERSADIVLAEKFHANFGKLPWPVDNGVIVKPFGVSSHPTLKGIQIENNGIDISTLKGNRANSVFEGEVRAIFSIPGMQKAVMVNHGDYFTVYTHLQEVFVQKGQKVKTQEPLGILYTDPDDGKTIVHFELWKGSEKQNPATWLRSR